MTLENPNSPHDNTWWGRASGGREVLRVAAPLVISSLSWTVMTYTDRVFLNWVSGPAMAAAFSASAVWILLCCLPLGVCTYCNTFVAQYDGARQFEKIGACVWQAVWIALLFSPLVLAAVPLAGPVFALAGHDETVYQYEVKYLQILCFGAPAMLIAQAAASFYSGRGKTYVVMFTDGTFALVNLVLAYMWILGKGGFPAGGVVGAGLATTVSLWLKAITYLALFLQREYRQQYGTIAGLRFDRHLFSRLLFFGGPSGLQMLLDTLGFTAFILLVGRLGVVESEATSVAFSISTLAFMPIWGLHLAVSVLVGERLGENRDDLAARATFTTLQVAWIYMVIISLVYVFAPGIFLRTFFPNESVLTPQQADVYRTTATLLCFVAAYNLFDATLMFFAGAIKGAGDTTFIFGVSLALATFLATASYLAVEVWHLDVKGCWALVIIWVWTAAAIYATRFLRGKWRSMRVIEPAASNT